MSTEPLAPAEAIARLNGVLEYYQRVRRQNPVRVLARAGQNLSIQLYKGFAATAERPGEISFAAWLRGWRVGRDDPAESGPEHTGLSAEAIKRARARMGGFASILAMVAVENNRITLRGVRRAKRNPRRRILGGRRGLGGVAVAGTDAVLRRPGDVRLNFRAVATVEELNVREAGRRFLAVAWLHRRWQTLAQGDSRRDGQLHRVLRNQNPRSRLGLLGTATLQGSAANNEATLALTSRAPGTAAVGRRHGLFAAAVAAVTNDMGSFALKQETEQLKRAFAEKLRR